MIVAIGCDHGGFILKAEILEYLKANNHEIIDFGINKNQAVDYPDFGLAVAECVAQGKADRGILMCGTGIGISIAANKIKGIRCALLSDTFSAKATREHNDANVMAMGGRVIGAGLAADIVDMFLNTSFSGDDRHKRRIDKITAIENT